jgi:acetylornithine deacetylase
MDSREILEALVGFDTTSVRSNLDLIDWIEGYLAPLGADITRLPSSDKQKATLLARMGPATAGGMMLCGHTDTVPVVGQPWTRTPFKLSADNGRLYGRGTTDMKGFIASALAVAPLLAQAHLLRPVVYAFTYDEEVGCLAVRDLALHLENLNLRPAAVVVGEPTEMRVVRAHKSVRVLRTTVKGRGAHSSRPDAGASAINAMARVIGFLDAMMGDLASSCDVDEQFDPPGVTVNVGTVTGGTAVNVVPADCEITWEYRCPPSADRELPLTSVSSFIRLEVEPVLREHARNGGIKTEVLADVPALDARKNAKAAALIADIGGLEEGQPVAFGTEAAGLLESGMPSVVCGPGSMAQGHQPDEFVDEAELDGCDRFMSDLAGWAQSVEVGQSATGSR